MGLISQDQPTPQTQADDPNDEVENDQEATKDNIKDMTEDELQKEMERIESQQLEELKKQLETEINALDSVFQQIKDQILIDFTALGLRIQIVDKDQRPMFDVGSANLQTWSSDVLHALAPIPTGNYRQIVLTLRVARCWKVVIQKARLLLCRAWARQRLYWSINPASQLTAALRLLCSKKQSPKHLAVGGGLIAVT